VAGHTPKRWVRPQAQDNRLASRRPGLSGQSSRWEYTTVALQLKSHALAGIGLPRTALLDRLFHELPARLILGVQRTRLWRGFCLGLRIHPLRRRRIYDCGGPSRDSRVGRSRPRHGGSGVEWVFLPNAGGVPAGSRGLRSKATIPPDRNGNRLDDPGRGRSVRPSGTPPPLRGASDA
jgi:hypothetical protein